MSKPQSALPDDFIKIKQDQETTIKEQWVGIMTAREVREQLQKCWRTEGVNHYEVCHPLTAKYLDLLRENRIVGYTKLDFSS
ncbi:hypothetical protein T439DRAFT_325425 [Meredithblackwellia eburnea MCA 4105]